MVKTYTNKTSRFKKHLNKRKHRKPVIKHKNAEWLKIKTVGLPQNLITFMRYDSKTYYYNTPQSDTTGSAYWTLNGTSFAFGHNMINPMNLTHLVGGGVPKPAPDATYFGIAPTPTTEGNPTDPPLGQYTWNHLSYWAEWYTKMRISHVWLKITIRPVQNAVFQPGQGTTVLSSVDPFSLTILDAKYVSGVMTPENLALKDQDDLRATRGCKTMIFSGQRSKPIVLFRRVSVADLLGVKDLADTGYETQCSVTSNLVDNKNPTVRNQTFTYLRIGRPPNQSMYNSTASQFRFGIQCKLICKAHFSQLDLNNPHSLIGGTTGPGPLGNEDPFPDEAGPTFPGGGPM